MNIPLVVFPTYISIIMRPDHIHYEQVRNFIHNHLSEYNLNRRYGRFEKVLSYKYRVYKIENFELRLPRNILDTFLNSMMSKGIVVDIIQGTYVEPERVRIPMYFTEKDELQIQAVQFLTNNNPYQAMKCLALQTGRGKTFCANKSSSVLGYRTLINTGGLTEQWARAIEEQTGLVEPDVFMIKGVQSLGKLSILPEKPSIIIASVNTLRKFILGGGNYDCLPWTFEQFIEEYHFGIKIVDECHELFYLNTLIDMHCRIKHNFYLSATLIRSDNKSNSIFEKIFPFEYRFGEDEYFKYVDIYYYSYRLNIGRCSIRSIKGYSHVKYEARIFKMRTLFQEFMDIVLIPLINMHYFDMKKDGERCLIFLSRVDSIATLVTYLQEKYPNLTVSEYIGNSPIDNLQSDIIITTLNKGSTGLDIPKLLTVINTISFKSEPKIKQQLGRLRELVGSQPVMVDIYNELIEDHVRHSNDKRRNYYRYGKSFQENKLQMI